MHVKDLARADFERAQRSKMESKPGRSHADHPRGRMGFIARGK